MSELTPGDYARYAGLAALASLVLLVVLGNREGSLVILLAVYLVVASAGVLYVSVRRERS